MVGDSTCQRKRKEILMKYLCVPVLIVTLLAGTSFAGEPLQLKDENDRLNYSYGFHFAETLKREGVKINEDTLMRGIQDALSGVEPQMTQEEMGTTVKEFQKQKQIAKYRERQIKRDLTRKEGEEFLAANGKKPGVVILPSGLQYKVIKEGTGRSPGPSDEVTVNYRGTLINGNEFDSTYRKGKPEIFRVDRVIAGWTEALQLMKEGGKWQLFIPPELAYRKRGPLEDQTLIFEVELISVK
jgi:FKBP-type peptidyl-prolyl cis-trans isomerase FklB